MTQDYLARLSVIPGVLMRENQRKRHKDGSRGQ